MKGSELTSTDTVVIRPIIVELLANRHMETVRPKYPAMAIHAVSNLVAKVVQTESVARHRYAAFVIFLQLRLSYI